ncbi:MAG: aldehyde dehydrogenase family protein [Bacteroidales bacterium]|nr:aldehyde dehydrogenase family protein [Bacteroidales bacterium]
MKQFLIYAGGEFKKTNNILEVINPYNNEVVATTYLGSFEDLEFSIEKALKVKTAMKEMPSYLRYQILDQIARELELQKTEFSKILCLESGKPWKYAAGEVDRAIQARFVSMLNAYMLNKASLNNSQTLSLMQSEH